MKKKNVGHKAERFTRHQLDKHRALLASAPDVIEKRQHMIEHRNQMIAGIQAYNLGLEKLACNRTLQHARELCRELQQKITSAT